MRAFLSALIALVLITIAANQFLNWRDMSAANTTVSEPNVRLGDE